jgi:hypothetical protein
VNVHQSQAIEALAATFTVSAITTSASGAWARVGAMTVWLWWRPVSQDWSAELQLESEHGSTAIRTYAGVDAMDALRKLNVRRQLEADLHRMKAAVLERLAWPSLPVGNAGGES